jgi:exonuclease 3'-5' domain-containing protein 2
MLYDALECKRKQLRPVPPRPYHADLNLPIRLASGAVISTTDDTVDEFEPKQKSMMASPVSPASDLEAAAENIQIEDDAEQNSISSIARTKPKVKSTGSTSPATLVPRPQSLVDAESWALAHRASDLTLSPSRNSPPAVAFSALRVYALWYFNPSLSIPDIASMLRDPPLRNSTVAAYIIDSVRLEKLPFEKERLRKVLQVASDSHGMWRYKRLWKLVE